MGRDYWLHHDGIIARHHGQWASCLFAMDDIRQILPFPHGLRRYLRCCLCRSWNEKRIWSALDLCALLHSCVTGVQPYNGYVLLVVSVASFLAYMIGRLSFPKGQRTCT